MGRFELHCHSHHSRGGRISVEALASPREIVAHASRLGLSGIAITDHDTGKAWREAGAEARKLGMVSIPAMEVSSSAGHIIGLGLSEGVPKGMGAGETMDAIRSQGGLCVAVHPFDAKGEGIRKLMDIADVAEAFNALSMERLGNMAAEGRAKKKGLSMVAGSDAHSLEMIGTACNEIEAGSMDEALHAIRHGKVRFERNYIPLGVMTNWLRERFTLSYSQVMAYIDKNYRGPKAWIARGLLRDYVMNGRPWERMAGIGLGAVAAYNAVRLMAYY